MRRAKEEGGERKVEGQVRGKTDEAGGKWDGGGLREEGRRRLERRGTEEA